MFSRERSRSIVCLALWCAACGAGYPLGAENAAPLVRADAERELDCPPEDIRVEEAWGGTFEAIGCGEKIVYRANCDGVRCAVMREGEGFVPFKDRPEDLPR